MSTTKEELSNLVNNLEECLTEMSKTSNEKELEKIVKNLDAYFDREINRRAYERQKRILIEIIPLSIILILCIKKIF